MNWIKLTRRWSQGAGFVKPLQIEIRNEVRINVTAEKSIIIKVFEEKIANCFYAGHLLIKNLSSHGKIVILSHAHVLPDTNASDWVIVNCTQMTC